MQMRAFYQKMKAMNFQPKVKQLEELKVAFDDANNPDGALPQNVNSKSKSHMGPTNNQTDRFQNFSRKLKEAKAQGKGAAFGFVVHQDSSDEEKLPEE